LRYDGYFKGYGERTRDDLWCLEISHSQDLPCPHLKFGLDYADRLCCFCVDPVTPDHIQQAGRSHEFLLMTHWQEHTRNDTGDWMQVQRDHFLHFTGYGIVVLAILILRNGDTAERVTLVPVPVAAWAAASPQEVVINLL
jgi:hypothetical protein